MAHTQATHEIASNHQCCVLSIWNACWACDARNELSVHSPIFTSIRRMHTIHSPSFFRIFPYIYFFQHLFPPEHNEWDEKKTGGLPKAHAHSLINKLFSLYICLFLSISIFSFRCCSCCCSSHTSADKKKTEQATTNIVYVVRIHVIPHIHTIDSHYLWACSSLTRAVPC